MTMSFRPRGGDGPQYAPERDFAYSHVRLIECCIRSWNLDLWPQLRQFCEDHETTIVELTAAKDAYCSYINKCCEDPQEKVEDVLHRAGWHEVPLLAQLAWLAMLGTVMTGQLFQGLRDVTLQGDRPYGTEQLAMAGHEARRAMLGSGDLEEDFAMELTSWVDAVRDAGLDPLTILMKATGRTRKALLPPDLPKVPRLVDGSCEAP